MDTRCGRTCTRSRRCAGRSDLRCRIPDSSPSSRPFRHTRPAEARSACCGWCDADSCGRDCRSPSRSRFSIPRSSPASRCSRFARPADSRLRPSQPSGTRCRKGGENRAGNWESSPATAHKTREPSRCACSVHRYSCGSPHTPAHSRSGSVRHPAMARRRGLANSLPCQSHQQSRGRRQLSRKGQGHLTDFRTFIP